MFLVTGADGQLGHELRNVLGDSAVYAGRGELDITDETAVKEFFAARQFDFVVNAAAYTAVDAAEDEAEKARRINTDGARYLARYGRNIIHISTDYVFDGRSCIPYAEDNAVNPLNVYGKTKLLGERAVLEEAATAAVIRTSWLYSPYGKNFVKTMISLGRSREEINVVFDQAGTPTCARDLAAAIAVILPQIKDESREVYHYSGEGVCSWYDFAVEIMAISGLKCRVRPIKSSSYPVKAGRPHYSVLDKSKIKQRFNLEIPHWRESLQQCLKRF